MGRRAQSKEEKEAKGYPGKRAALEKSAIADARIMAGIPLELSIDATKFWKIIAPELQRLNFLRETDKQSFARYCEYLVEWWRLTKDLDENGYTQMTDSLHVKMERARPQFLVRERIENRLLALEDRFGMNTATRQTILMRMAGMPARPPTPDDGELPLHSPENPNDLSPASAGKPSSALGYLRHNISNRAN